MPYKVETASVRWRKKQPTVITNKWEVESYSDRKAQRQTAKTLKESREKKENGKPRSKAKSKAIRKMQAAGRKRLHKIHLRKVISEKRLALTKGKYEGDVFLRPLETTNNNQNENNEDNSFSDKNILRW